MATLLIFQKVFIFQRKFFTVLMLILFIDSFLLSEIKAQNTGGQYTQTVRGIILEKDILSPLPFVSVVLQSDSTKGTLSDMEGKFRLEKVPVGRHDLKFTMFGYKEFIASVLVSSGKEVVITVEMEQDVLEMEEVVLDVKKDKSENNNNLITTSGINLRTEEINRFAGSRQDPSRMASNFAGVASGGDQRNDIIVRGNSPMGVLWRLEGVDIPNPNHFSFTGNTGGAFSILNNNLLANSDFLTGAFPAEYGNKTAAVFDVKLRKGNNEKREHTFQAGLNGIEFGTEGPLSKKSGSSYLANFRFFTFEALSKLGVSIGANGIPQYIDGTFKIDLPTEKAGTFSIWAIGGKSSIYIQDPVLKDSSEFSATSDDFSSTMFATGISNAHFWGKHTSGKLTISMTGSNKNVASFSTYKTGGEFQDYDLINSEGQYQVNYTLTHKLNHRHLLKVGITARDIHYNNKEKYYDSEDSLFIDSWDQKGHAGLYQSYIHWQYIISEKVTMNNGLYYQYFRYNNTQSLEPRLAISYAPDKKQKISLATGLHSQAHDLFVYQTRFLDKSSNTYYQPNKNLKFTKSLHVVAGYQRTLSPNVRLKTEAYYQYLYDVPVTASTERGGPVYSILNTGADYSFFIPDSTVNEGTGRNMGIEVTLEKYFDKDYYFLTNLSLFDSRYKGYDKIMRHSAFNLGHVFNFLAGKEFHLDETNKKILSADLRVNYSGGRRIVGVDEQASLQEGKTVYDFDNAYNTKVKNYFRTDVKVSYTINRPSATHNFFVAADNVLNTQNVLSQDWDADEKKVVTYYQLGLFPYLGYKVQF